MDPPKGGSTITSRLQRHRQENNIVLAIFTNNIYFDGTYSYFQNKSLQSSHVPLRLFDQDTLGHPVTHSNIIYILFFYFFYFAHIKH